MKFKILTGCLIFLSAIFRIEGQNSNDLKVLSQFNYEDKIIYKTVNGDTLDMLIFSPIVKTIEKRPIMIFIHGGGWGGGSKYGILGPNFLNTIKILLENGIYCATVEYRLTRQGKSTVKDCVVDCKDAARFLIKNADKYSLDVNKMGIWGASAGGHLCLMTALGNNSEFIGDEKLSKYNPRFVCVASYYPLTSFIRSEYLVGSNFEKPTRFIVMFGGLLSDNQKMAKALSPAEILSKDAPPILLLHGDNDKILPIPQSKYMLDEAKKVGANVSLYIVKNAGHSFIGDSISPSMVEINQHSANFMMKYLLVKN